MSKGICCAERRLPLARGGVFLAFASDQPEVEVQGLGPSLFQAARGRV